MEFMDHPAVKPDNYDGPATLPIKPQPTPLACKVSVLPYPCGLQARATARVFRRGESRLCTRCETCSADHDLGFCLTHEEEPIPVSSVVMRAAGSHP